MEANRAIPRKFPAAMRFGALKVKPNMDNRKRWLTHAYSSARATRKPTAGCRDFFG